MKTDPCALAKRGLPAPPWKALVCIPLITLAFFCQAASSQEKGADEGAAMAAYVRSKYKVDHVYACVRRAEQGPAGSIFIIGDLTPKQTGGGQTKDDRTRGIAKALIQGEPELFGAVDFNELREESFTTDEYGYTHIGYRRYIGALPLEAMNIVVHVGPDERISSVSAVLAPVPAELRREAAKETISRESLRPIIEEDLKAGNVKYTAINLLRSEKVARPAAPYVVWLADVNLAGGIGRWIYAIDAFTGKVIEKRNALVE